VKFSALAPLLTLALIASSYGGAMGKLDDCKTLTVVIRAVNTTDAKAEAMISLTATNLGKNATPGTLIVSSGLLSGPGNAMQPLVAPLEEAPFDQVYKLCKEIDAAYVLPPSTPAGKVPASAFSSLAVSVNGWQMKMGPAPGNTAQAEKLLRLMKSLMSKEQSDVANSLFP